MRRILTFSATLVIIAVACNQGPAQSTDDRVLSAERLATTKEYVALNCQSCHAPNADHDSRLAPPFFAIRKHYLKEFPEQADFEKAIKSFVEKPNEEHALMLGAIEKFGLMPPMMVEEEQLRDIATYLYQVEQEHPQHSGKGNGAHGKGPGAEVKRLALSTKKVLGKNLMGALKDGGKEHALSFCNVQAIPLTDSMSNHLKHRIARVSDKARNPDNKANAAELEILNDYQAALNRKEEMSPRIIRGENGDRGYFPILTNPMCLQCHGKIGAELESDFYQKVRELYPEDEATGYGPGELRGMWVVDLDSL